MIAEGQAEASETLKQSAWQFLIDSGAVWNLQGWFGRRACELIADGRCNVRDRGSVPQRASELIDTLTAKRLERTV